jgi:hypothetical protein
MNQNLLFSLILILAIGIPVFFNSLQKMNQPIMENYTNLGTSPVPRNNYKQKYLFPQTDVLLEDSFPLTGRGGVSNDQGSKIWWHYPIFEVGSYDQITNNLKFSNNPDTGRCMPADVCGTLYKEYQTQSNYVFPQPPVKPECGSRINYYYTPTSFLTYRADTANILY